MMSGMCVAGAFCTMRRRESALRAGPRGSAATDAVGTIDACDAEADVVSATPALIGLCALPALVGLCEVSLLAETARNAPTTTAAVAEATRIFPRRRASMRSLPMFSDPTIFTAACQKSMPACTATCAVQSIVPPAFANYAQLNGARGAEWAEPIISRQKMTDGGARHHGRCPRGETGGRRADR